MLCPSLVARKPKQENKWFVKQLGRNKPSVNFIDFTSNTNQALYYELTLEKNHIDFTSNTN